MASLLTPIALTLGIAGLVWKFGRVTPATPGAPTSGTIATAASPRVGQYVRVSTSSLPVMNRNALGSEVSGFVIAADALMLTIDIVPPPRPIGGAVGFASSQGHGATPTQAHGAREAD
jgi:hypothetical protein